MKIADLQQVVICSHFSIFGTLETTLKIVKNEHQLL